MAQTTCTENDMKKNVLPFSMFQIVCLNSASIDNDKCVNATAVIDVYSCLLIIGVGIVFMSLVSEAFIQCTFIIITLRTVYLKLNSYLIMDSRLSLVFNTIVIYSIHYVC